jgi:hypothetical protein
MLPGRDNSICANVAHIYMLAIGSAWFIGRKSGTDSIISMTLWPIELRNGFPFLQRVVKGN